MRKKPKRLIKAKLPKDTPKMLPNQKSKNSVSENCLPLKKRRCHMASNQVQSTKPATTDVKPVQGKRNFSLTNSFDETIEECIRKHMMMDEVASEKTVPAPSAKLKGKKTKIQTSSESIDETIDNCIKNFTPCSKEKSSSESSSKMHDSEVEDLPLASLAKLKNRKNGQFLQKGTKVSAAALEYRQKRKRLLKEACIQAKKPFKEEQPEVVINGQKKKRRFNKTGFVKVKRKKTRPVNNEVIEVCQNSTQADGEVIDLTTEDTVLDAIESVVKASVEPEISRSRRKRKNVAQKCEIEVLDLTSGNDENDIEECTVPKKPKVSEEDEELLEPKYQQVIQVTEPSSGRKAALSDPRKMRRKEVHFPKKKYLRAGFYSAFFKQDSTSCKKSSKKSKSREVKEYNPEEHEFGLMPPPIHV
ncbi:hypothetical protein X975_26034, partial [Stegodyphus mimosarum]